MATQKSSSMLLAIQSTRPPFLLLTPACILLGIGASVHLGASLSGLNVFFILTCGLLGHISVNAFNEYFDFKSGLDLKTQKTPFSGGSGTLPNHPALSHFVLLIAIISLLLCIGIGLYFIKKTGWELLALGLLGVLLIVFYTTHITKSPWLCLIAPGLAFGPIMIVGTGWIMLGHFSVSMLLISFIPFFLVNNLLLLNQFPDIDADKMVGRCHFPIRFGTYISTYIFALFNASAAITIIYLSMSQRFSLEMLLGVIPVCLLFFLSLWFLKKYRDQEDLSVLLPKIMPINVATNLITPTIVGIVLWVFSP